MRILCQNRHPGVRNQFLTNWCPDPHISVQNISVLGIMLWATHERGVTQDVGSSTTCIWVGICGKWDNRYIKCGKWDFGVTQMWEMGLQRPCVTPTRTHAHTHAHTHTVYVSHGIGRCGCSQWWTSVVVYLITEKSVSQIMCSLLANTSFYM